MSIQANCHVQRTKLFNQALTDGVKSVYGIPESSDLKCSKPATQDDLTNGKQVHSESIVTEKESAIKKRPKRPERPRYDPRQKHGLFEEIKKRSLQKQQSSSTEEKEIACSVTTNVHVDNGSCVPQCDNNLHLNQGVEQEAQPHLSEDKSTCDIQDEAKPYSFSVSALPAVVFSEITSLLNGIEKDITSEKYNVEKIMIDVRLILKKYLKGVEARVYGSRYSGLATGSSNLNIEIFVSDCPITNGVFHELKNLFRQKNLDYIITFHEHLKVKQSKFNFIDPYFGLSCEMRYLGRRDNSFKISEFLKKVSDTDPVVKTLIILLRHWAETCEIHEAENGRLHPICFSFMVIHFLQQQTPPFLLCDIECKNLHTNEIFPSAGELWLRLFEYYAQIFNWKDHVVSVSSLQPVLKETKTWAKCWIGIEDPFDPDNNLAKSVVSQDVSSFIKSCFWRTFKYFSSSHIGKIPEQVDNCDEGYGSALSSVITGCSNDLSSLYCFNASNFIEGENLPVFCPVCEELGFTCGECNEDIEEKKISSLPQMTSSFMANIETALEEIFEIHGIKKEEINRRKDFVTDLENYLRKTFPDAKLTVIGSSANGFGFNNSDLDICLMFENKSEESVNKKEILRRLRTVLLRNRDFTHVCAVYSAKVPLVKFYHSKTGLHGDISLYNELAVHNTRLLCKYSEIDCRARVLGCAMKLLAKNACIADTTQKSLSSYSYVLMVIHYLQRTNPPVLPFLQELPNGFKKKIIVHGCDVYFYDDVQNLKYKWESFEKNKTSCGELWLDLLRYYTERFNFDCVINIRQSGDPLKCQQNTASKLFHIVDPFIIEKNLGSIMNEPMTVKTYRTFLRARKLFGTPVEQLHAGYKSFKEYFFDPRNLTDGRVMKIVECNLCGKIGHNQSECYNFKMNQRQCFSTWKKLH